MEYFVMLPDKRIKKPLTVDPETMDFNAKDAFVSYADFESDTIFIDYFITKKLFQYSFCVSDELKEMLDVYSDHLFAVPFFITDKRQQGQKVYWKLRIELQDCVVEKSDMRYDNLTLNKECINGKYIFRIAFQKQEYLIISLNLAENILRKYLTGIQFIPVNLQ